MWAAKPRHGNFRGHKYYPIHRAHKEGRTNHIYHTTKSMDRTIHKEYWDVDSNVSAGKMTRNLPFGIRNRKGCNCRDYSPHSRNCTLVHKGSRKNIPDSLRKEDCICMGCSRCSRSCILFHKGSRRRISDFLRKEDCICMGCSRRSRSCILFHMRSRRRISGFFYREDCICKGYSHCIRSCILFHKGSRRDISEIVQQKE